jgi:hypothetical protein
MSDLVQQAHATRPTSNERGSTQKGVNLSITKEDGGQLQQ